MTVRHKMNFDINNDVWKKIMNESTKRSSMYLVSTVEDAVRLHVFQQSPAKRWEKIRTNNILFLL